MKKYKKLLLLSFLSAVGIIIIAAVGPPPPLKYSWLTTNASSGVFAGGQVPAWDSTAKRWIPSGTAGNAFNPNQFVTNTEVTLADGASVTNLNEWGLMWLGGFKVMGIGDGSDIGIPDGPMLDFGESGTTNYSFYFNGNANYVSLSTQGLNPDVATTGTIPLGIPTARWSGVAAGAGDFMGSVTSSGTYYGNGSGLTNLQATPGSVPILLQSCKLPSTNFATISGGWQDWEVDFAKTNGSGVIFANSATWQCVLPQDYKSNTMTIRILSTLAATNGPNTSNTIFRASVLAVSPGSSTDVRVGSFGSQVSGTNIWLASASGTNQVQSVSISMAGNTSNAQAGDVLLLKLDRDAPDDTFGLDSAVVGIEIDYSK